MPAQIEPPSVAELLEMYAVGTGLKDRESDDYRGSIYEHVGGPAAILFNRLGHRVRDEFRENYFRYANRRLEDHILARFNRSRIQDTPGTGYVIVNRATTAGGAGVFRAGTRIRASRSTRDDGRYYLVQSDTPVAVNAVRAQVPIVAGVNGLEGEIQDHSDNFVALAFKDLLWDNSWTIERILCSPGTSRERNEEYRENALKERQDERIGYPTGIEIALREKGARQFEFFPSNWLGDDSDAGVNNIIIGDDAFEATAELMRDCRLALDSVVMAGSAVQLFAMTRTLLSLTATVRLYDLPERFDTIGTAESAKSAIVDYFEHRENPFLWKESAIRSAIWRSVRNVNAIDIELSAPEPVASQLFIDDPVPRYLATPWSVHVQITGPS